MNAGKIDEKREAMEGFLRAWTKGLHVSTLKPDVVKKCCVKPGPKSGKIKKKSMSLRF
jgi:hypothetical protein